MLRLYREEGLRIEFADGGTLRVLNLVDDFTRECLENEVDRSLSAERVTALLERIAKEHGLPKTIVMDNGRELASKELHRWAYRNT